MLVNLPNGKTVDIPAEQYYSIPDDKIDDFLWEIALSGKGVTLSDPFAFSYSKPNKEEVPESDQDYQLDEDEIKRAEEEFFKDYEEDLDYDE